MNFHRGLRAGRSSLSVGGRCKWVHPEAEIAVLHGADTTLNGNVRKLTRILKQWQRHCDVPIKSSDLPFDRTRTVSRQGQLFDAMVYRKDERQGLSC